MDIIQPITIRQIVGSTQVSFASMSVVLRGEYDDESLEQQITRNELIGFLIEYRL